MTEDQQQQLSALLRLKRYEQPPAGYFEKLVLDVHRRQRADLLRRPAWKLALERVQTFLGQYNFGYGSYAGAMATIVVVGVAIMTLSAPQHKQSTETSSGLAAQQAPVDLRSDRVSDSVLSLQSSPIVVAAASPINSIPANARLFPSRMTPGAISGGQPRYVLDAQPVSYEATTVSFNF